LCHPASAPNASSVVLMPVVACVGGCQGRLIEVVGPDFQPKHGLDVFARVCHVLVGGGFQRRQMVKPALDFVSDVPAPYPSPQPRCGAYYEE
jgi:hypothetical protein